MAAGLLVVSTGGAWTQERTPRHKSQSERHHAATIATPRVAYRGLTVNRRPDTMPGQGEDGDDVLVDGPIRYGDIHGFNPSPYASSGQQFPYGFDGIGGYGSDLGVEAGQNASIYDRGR